jgi:hypothetical protein
MVDVITESGMDFIADNTFHIEKSQLYTSLGEGIRSVEFVRIKNNKLLFVEAKTTFPDPEKSENNFQTQINDICEKFIHSLSLYSSIKVGINEEIFANDFMPPKKSFLIFILVIKKHEIKWCKPIKQELTRTLPPCLKRYGNRKYMS